MVKAVEYMEAANSLTTTGKLQTEVKPRNLSQEQLIEQILLACKQASNQLDAQVKQSYASQDYFYKWIKETQFKSYYQAQPTAEQREHAIVEMNAYYDRCRQDLSEVRAKIESIISDVGSKYAPRRQA